MVHRVTLNTICEICHFLEPTTLQGWRVFAGVRSNAAAEQLAGLNDNITAVVIDVTKYVACS